MMSRRRFPVLLLPVFIKRQSPWMIPPHQNIIPERKSSSSSSTGNTDRTLTSVQIQIVERNLVQDGSSGAVRFLDDGTSNIEPCRRLGSIWDTQQMVHLVHVLPPFFQQRFVLNEIHEGVQEIGHRPHYVHDHTHYSTLTYGRSTLCTTLSPSFLRVTLKVFFENLRRRPAKCSFWYKKVSKYSHVYSPLFGTLTKKKRRLLDTLKTRKHEIRNTTNKKDERRNVSKRDDVVVLSSLLLPFDIVTPNGARHGGRRELSYLRNMKTNAKTATTMKTASRKT